MGNSKKRTVSTNLQCNVCNNIQTIRRLDMRQKKSGHTKHIYCYKCREITAHTELRDNWEMTLEMKQEREKVQTR